jgi:hypothetical protein
LRRNGTCSKSATLEGVLPRRARPDESLEESAHLKPELYQRVASRLDLDEHRLKKGDVSTLIDRIPDTSGGEPAVALEVFNAVGKSISVVAVKESDIEP